MDATELGMLADLDPHDLGARVRTARLARGWRQSELCDRVAGDGISLGYLSRIESGTRRPAPAVVQKIAVALGLDVEELLGGVSARERDEVRLAVDYAEIALESGQSADALTRAGDAAVQATDAGLHELALRARLLRARALEAEGRVDEAVDALLPLVEDTVGWEVRGRAAIGLVRCLRESGDLARAVEVGDRLLAALDDASLGDSDEAVQLTVTVASACHQRGDVAHAVRLCRSAVAAAEAAGSPAARAAAYWNTSIVESKAGNTGDAVDLAGRALALLQGGGASSTRHLVLLRTQLAILQLRLDPPDLDGAREQLALSGDDLGWAGTTPADRADHVLARAHLHFLEGDLAETLRLCAEVTDGLGDDAPLVRAEAHALEGQVHAVADDAERALERYRAAVAVLTGVGADREAARVWHELGLLLEDLDEPALARDAFRGATAALGVTSSRRLRPIGAPDLEGLRARL